MSKLSIGGTRRQRKCFSHYESMINGRKSPKYDCRYCFGADIADGDAGDHKGDEGGNLLGEVSLLRSGQGVRERARVFET